MQLGKTGEGETIEVSHILAIALSDQRQHIVSVIVPSAHRRMSIPAGNHTKFRERRRADEALVGVDVIRDRMIDGQQTNLIEIYGLFHRFHEAETKQAIAGAHTLS